MKPKFYRKKLKNGMVVILEKRNLPIVSLAIAVKQGGVNELANEKGISHYIEHMLYKGTPTRSAEKIAAEIERNGGDLNGFTEETVTAYWCKMPSKHLNVALGVLSDMVKNPLFDEKEMEKEKRVIFEEMKIYEDNPRHHAFEKIHEMLYKKPFGIPLIGTEKTVGSVTRKQILKKFNEVYKPNNMILCAVGDADFKQLVRFAEKTFEGKKGKTQRIKIARQNSSRIEKRKGIGQANVVFAYHVPGLKDKKSYAAFTLNVLMAGGMSSRLFHEIRGKRNLAYAVTGQCDINNDYSHNTIYIGTMKQNVGKVKGLILEEFEKVAKSLDEKELNEVKEQIIGNHLIATEDSQVQLVNLLAHEVAGDARKVYDFEKNIRAVRLKHVRELAAEARKKHSFFALVPA